MAQRTGRVLAAAVIAVGALTAPASGQPRSRVEIGADVAALRLSGIDATDAGVGARVAWLPSDWLGWEASAGVFLSGRGNVERGGRKVHVLFGPKVGRHWGGAGLFAKAGLGVARVGEGRQLGPCVAIFPQPESCYGAETRLAFDAGGGVEVRPVPRVALRVGVSDLMTRLGDQSARFGHTGDLAHDLRITAGVGFRF